MSETNGEVNGNGSGSGFVPPYGSFVTLNNLIDRMAEEGGVPGRIDRSYLSNLPGSVQSTTMHALKSLDLVNDDLEPTTALVELVDRPDERKGLLAGLIREKYAPQLALGPRATTNQLEESFRQSAGIQGSTLRKVIAFFIAAARYAEVPISPLFKTPKVTTSGERRTRRNDQNPPLNPAPDPTPPATPLPAAMKHELIAGLIRELPAPGTVFPEDKQEAWFAIAKATFRLIYKIDEGTPTSMTTVVGED